MEDHGTRMPAEAGSSPPPAAGHAEAIPQPARDALEVVREALDIPHAATAGDGETRDRILAERLLHAVIMLRGVLDEGGDIAWHVGYLRDRLAEHPATGYKTWDERKAELDAAKAQDGAK